MTNHTINAGLQIVPLQKSRDALQAIDRAIEVIQKSGLKHQVTPMETVIEGGYDEVMDIIKKAQQAALKAGAAELVVNIRLHLKKDMSVSFEEKTAKFN